MNTRVSKIAGLLAGTAIMLSVAGCVKVTPGELQTESKNIELGGAKTAKVDVSMGAGTLTMGGGVNGLMKAGFTYNVASWKPVVSYDVHDGEGELRIAQPGSDESFDMSSEGVRNEWTVNLNDQVPVDLTTHLGAGVSNFKLGSLSLNSFQLEMGAGESTVDLSGNYKHDFTANIQGGVGKTTVRLPRSVGVRVDVSKGIGDVNAGGLNRHGDSYENDAYGKSATTIHVDIQKGVGEVNLELGDEQATR